ncbi:CBN-EIF-3.J protein [Caenorhabditis brenneri]|uniref:CBN-EIF-3.J protein n=1 Tax=Caenorhabditis brenneri TaxID=135651 RepID=G0MIW6_CAEBE|nr:CBN-EIF-3.J protein [Caenorhabditis brenneri]
MADNWDDDDFEPEVSTFKREEPAPEPVKPVDVPVKKPAAPKTAQPLKKAPAFAMESLGRELSAAEKEEIQKQNDLALARDLFGDDDVGGVDDSKASYQNISSKADFEYWGERVGGFLASRHKAANYGDMIGKLLGAITENLTPADIQKMVTYLQQISTAKKAAEKIKAKTAPAAAAPAAKKNQKATLKVTKRNDNMLDDYGADDYDDYDDY